MSDGGQPHDCPEPADQCNIGVCNEESDSCDARQVRDGTACDDELQCTRNDACHEGACTGSITYALIHGNSLAGCLAGPEQEAGVDCGRHD